MKTQFFRFKYNDTYYEMSRPYNNPLTDSRTSMKWMRKCCRSVGADPKKVTHKEMTFSNWDFCVGVIF